MKISENFLKKIIQEEIQKIIENDNDYLSGPTRAGPEDQPVSNDPLSGPTRAGPQTQAKSQANTVPKQTVLNIQKQLTVLLQQINKVLGVK